MSLQRMLMKLRIFTKFAMMNRAMRLSFCVNGKKKQKKQKKKNQGKRDIVKKVRLKGEN